MALLSTALFAVTGFGVSRLFGFGSQDAVLIGAALIFSSTIIGIKLLPTTVLHHRHLGELMIALLLFQDLMAIIVLVLMESVGHRQHLVASTTRTPAHAATLGLYELAQCEDGLAGIDQAI